MKRIYEYILNKHLQNRQMAFIVGPRQVGKTTTCTSFTKNIKYFNWDNQNHRMNILQGPDKIADILKLNQMHKNMPVVVFDEIHKYSKWKTFLKGVFDTYSKQIKIIVTGSSRLDIYKKSGDSLMGRYFLYHMHPLTIREAVYPVYKRKELNKPVYVKPSIINNLLKYGGFPEPFLKKNMTFYNKWKNLREQQLFKEDIRDITRIQELGQVQILALLLKSQAGQLFNYNNLANKVNVSVDTIRRWIRTFESMYYCFLIRPWSKNVSRSLLKEPKLYLWDWSQVQDKGLKKENFVASHILKFVHWLNDSGHGDYGLFFLRDKEKREVDFLITKNNKPWFLVEVKSSKDRRLSSELVYFQKQLNAPYAFQTVFDMSFIDKDCFSYKTPIIVPVQTLLSQLI